jgi:hypothetical protein
MVYMILYALAWIIGIVYYSIGSNHTLIQSITLAQLVIGVGFFGVWNFVAHTIMSERVAQSIGWVSNGFQKELGWVSLGIGISGILCYWVRDGFWWATAIPFSTFLFGAAGLHVVELVRKKNLHPGNTWIIIPDILMPVTILVLLILNTQSMPG